MRTGPMPRLSPGRTSGTAVYAGRVETNAMNTGHRYRGVDEFNRSRTYMMTNIELQSGGRFRCIDVWTRLGIFGGFTGF